MIMGVEDLISQLLNRKLLMGLFFSYLQKMGWTGETRVRPYKNGLLLFIGTHTQEQALALNSELIKILNEYKSYVSPESPKQEPVKINIEQKEEEQREVKITSDQIEQGEKHG